MGIKVAQNAIFSRIRKFDSSQINLVEIIYQVCSFETFLPTETTEVTFVATEIWEIFVEFSESLMEGMVEAGEAFSGFLFFLITLSEER